VYPTRGGGPDGSSPRFALLGVVAAISPVEMTASADPNANDPGRLAFESMNAFHAGLGFSADTALPACV
jgi:hypothetical protein